jgi:TonB family protein
VTIDLKKMEDEKKKEEKKKEKKKEENKPPQTHQGGGGPQRGRGAPRGVATQAALKLITSRSSSSSLSSYTLLGSKFTKDIDKVLGSVAGLTKTGQTRLGTRQGVSNAGWNEGYAAGGSGGVDDLLGGLWGGGGGGSGGLNLKAKGGAGLHAPQASEIDLGEESGQRSTESIVSVIRQHTPGLRHTFEKYLKMQPGFKGKVTFRFTIAASGSIIELSIVSSTTGSNEFDQEIRDKVKSWRFEPVKGKGNDVVTVPFTFSQ